MAAEVSWEYFTSANIFSISLNSKLLPCLTFVFSPYVIWLYVKTECVGYNDQFRFLHLKKLGFRCSVFPFLASCFLFCFVFDQGVSDFCYSPVSSFYRSLNHKAHAVLSVLMKIVGGMYFGLWIPPQYIVDLRCWLWRWMVGNNFSSRYVLPAVDKFSQITNFLSL